MMLAVSIFIVSGTPQTEARSQIGGCISSVASQYLIQTYACGAATMLGGPIAGGVCMGVFALYDAYNGVLPTSCRTDDYGHQIII